MAGRHSADDHSRFTAAPNHSTTSLHCRCAAAAAVVVVMLLPVECHSSAGSPAAQLPLCQGPSCQRMSDLLPTLQFQAGGGPKIQCSCADFDAGACFAPGCFPCAKSCFADPEVAALPGPFGTGLLCSSGCLPCCQQAIDPQRAANSTCLLDAACQPYSTTASRKTARSTAAGRRGAVSWQLLQRRRRRGV